MTALRKFALLLLILPLAAGAQKPLHIAAAADLAPVLPHLLKQFEQQSGIACAATYQSSAALSALIENGGPYDLFLSADFAFPERLIRDGLAAQPRPTAYARGTLVLWARNDAAVHDLSLATFHNPALRRLAIAHPRHAPYGRAAQAALERLGLMAEVQSKLVTAENIAQAAQFAASGNADAGLLSLTSALSPALRGQGHYYVMPWNSYPALLQGAVVLKNGANPAGARRLLDWLRSKAARGELEAAGLAPPEPALP